MAGDFFHQSQSVAIQNQSNCEITFDAQLKTSLLQQTHIKKNNKTKPRQYQVQETRHLVCKLACVNITKIDYKSVFKGDISVSRKLLS